MISETGFNSIEVGGELFKQLQIGYAELADPNTNSKIREIAEYLNGHPDPMFEISRVAKKTSPNMSKIDYFASYVQLNKQRKDVQEKLDKINKELEYYA
ncbi:MAG TPA: hypothetical protein DHV62_06550 [Elusimicrobia bacterium]|nr:hypothetical protein [Elusimicrobiota bacterium]